jgi:cytosine/adenosine deaminase-related metal-dependent hydrolase
VTEDFDARYTEGILEELPAESERRSALADPTAAPGEPFALRGCVLTPKRKHDDGYVVVNGATIASVGAKKPAGVKIVETDGVILPGLIDLHGHPEYNVFSAWEPPKLFTNRYRWRDSEEYKLVVREPWKKLTGDPSLLRDLTRYAEARALVGGATAIQGASAKYPGKEEALVRNVDLRIFGQHKARSMIDLGRTTPEDRRKMRAKIDAGEVTALYVHLAEGIDERSRKEFTELTDANLLTKATVIIHGTALTDDHLKDVKDAGAKVVWSPQSNLRLYGETTAAARAFERGIPVGLGADWLPSGSQSLLAELSVARRELQRQKIDLSPGQLNKALINAVTVDAARVAGLDGKLGELAEDKPADLLVLERHLDDPWENVVTAAPSWVQLVTIGGDLAYGRADWMGELLDDTSELESLVAWGNRMLLDTSYAAAGSDAPPPRLKEVRERLVDRYAQTGPIFA